MDALYADGFIWANLKYTRQIDVMVRLPVERRMYEQLMGILRALPEACKRILMYTICPGISKSGKCGSPSWTI